MLRYFPGTMVTVVDGDTMGQEEEVEEELCQAKVVVQWKGKESSQRLRAKEGKDITS